MPKICVVGSGRWGQNHVRTLHGLDMLGGICDVDSANLEALAQQYPGIQTFGDLDTALAQGFDGFTVATPAHTHVDVAAKILNAKLPALVEKPLALSSGDARVLKKLAEENGVELMVGHLMLFHPAIVRIKELIDDGLLGKIQYIYSNRINLGTVRSEENILWSFAPHDISIFQFLIGSKPIEVVARGGAFLQPNVHDSTMTVLTYENNVVCHNYVSWLHPFKEHRIVVIGSKGMIRFDDSSEDKSLLFYEKGIDWINGEPIKREGVTEKITYPDLAPLTAELQYFGEHLTGGMEKADANNAIEVLEILERASTQLQQPPTQDQPAPQAATAAATTHEDVRVHETARVDDGCTIGKGTAIWHYSHVQSGATIGTGCSLGQSVNVGNNVTIGNQVRIQNNVSVFEGVTIEDDVFCGPSMTFTNVLNPRVAYPVGSEAYAKTTVREGVSIGAHATIVCGNELGRYCFIAAGAVVTRDVPDFAFIIGVPGRQQGWATRGGERIPADFRGEWTCSISNKQYSVTADSITEL